MSRNKLIAIALGVTTLFIGSSANAQSEDPQGPTKPVVVVNTAANPVQVTGTVSGNVTISNSPTVSAQQAGAWLVGITGTPTVKIDSSANTVKLDPTANTVQLAPRGTRLIFDSGILVYSEDGTPLTFGPLDISPYSKIRLGVNNMGFHDVDIFVRSSLVNAGPNLGNAFSIDSFFVEDSEGDFDRGGPSISKVYDVVGTKLFVTVSFRGQTEGQYRIAVFGN